MTMGGREAAGGKILRCAQNDIGGKAQNDNGGEARNDNGGAKRREGRFFAALRMTGGEAQNDKRGMLSF